MIFLNFNGGQSDLQLTRKEVDVARSFVIS